MLLPLPPSMETSILELVIFTGFLYWMCPSFMNSLLERIAGMVDIVASRMFESFNCFSTNKTESLSTNSNLKRFSIDEKYERTISRVAETKYKNNLMVDLKEVLPDVDFKRNSIIQLACQHCALTSTKSLVNHTTENMALRNMFTRTPPTHNVLARYFGDFYYNWALIKYNYKLPSDQSILEDKRLKNSIERMSKEQLQDAEDKTDEEFYEKLMEKNRERAHKLLKEMKSALSDYVLRCSNWFFHKMFPLFLNSVLVHSGQISMLREASKSGVPLIFLPLHRSHLDYLLLTYIVVNHGLKAPIVAAGDNLKLPFFGQVLKGLGAFYIKRRIGPVEGRKDHIYKAVLHTYMNQSLKYGNNIEFYIEGGRTRTGKPLMPKYGILSVIVDSLLDGTIEDALLVPVSMNYDKLVDGDFTREQMGEPKKMENVLDTIKSLWKSVNGDYGMVKVDFHQPCSLRELVEAFQSDGSERGKKKLCSTVSNSSLYGTELVCTTNKSVIENISRHVVYDAYQSMSVMATNAVAFLLLTKFRKGVPIEDLAIALDILRQDLDYLQKEVSFQGNSIDVINYAVKMLGPALIRKEKINKQEIVKPQVKLPKSIELSYYSNTLVPHYAIDSIIALAINSLDNKTGFIDSEHLMEAAKELCNILQYEFIFCKPCQSLDQTIQYHLDDLIFRKHIFILDRTLLEKKRRWQAQENKKVLERKRRLAQENETFLEEECRKLAEKFNDDCDHEARITRLKYQLNKDPKACESLEFYRSIVLPLLECYAVSAQTLCSLVNGTMLETELVEDILDNQKMLLFNKSLLYSEAVSSDTAKNALKLFISWGILECHNEGKLRLYYLREDHDNFETSKILYRRIDRFRPEIN